MATAVMPSHFDAGGAARLQSCLEHRVALTFWFTGAPPSAWEPAEITGRAHDAREIWTKAARECRSDSV